MDYKFLNKVLDQIVRETRVDYDKEEVYFPFLFSPSHPSLLFPLSSLPILPLVPRDSLFQFSNHCRDIYGLNEEEIEYIWEEYREIIYNKIDG